MAKVRPAAPGTVVYAGDGLRGYGNLIIIKHSDIFLSAYGHNEKIMVKAGQTVTDTEILSKLGSKGILYFEIRKDGYPVNPASYIK
jgi:lipoprotein NlpD